ncbi:ribosomal protein L7/L12 [Streptomyces carpinensis]|uniref:Ribosomal protein L7/L12 n=1 Tax=Streptomyces carpinensis TaxID=66369 RepID=A0ABV1WFD4_9ACTN|nr:ribosomal protein L7/L12 [Streptomyces carpinensis]
MDPVAFRAVVVVVLAGVGSIESRLSRADRRMARVERELDLVLDHLDLREDDPRLDEVSGLVRAGKRIEAIKAYREATGAGLKEARDAVDRMAA